MRFESRNTHLWMAHEPFLADEIFLDGFVIGHNVDATCSQCKKRIKRNEEVIWRKIGKGKKLFHLEHEEGDQNA